METSKESMLKQKINLESTNIDNIKLIAGVDVAYYEKDNKEYGVCCIDVFDIETFEIVEKQNFGYEIKNPYVPGYLSYRELPIILETYKKLESKPDIFMLDGNGYLHHNHLGIATMFGLATNEKCIGVAKSFYNFSKIDFHVDKELLSTSPIIINEEIYGYVMRSRYNCNPIFISPGNGLSFQDCIDVVKKCLSDESRIPIPTRMADLDTHIERKRMLLKCK